MKTAKAALFGILTITIALAVQAQSELDFKTLADTRANAEAGFALAQYQLG